jgi:dephospho-CoA kinase
LEAFGALILDCDAIYHELLENDDELLSELYSAFPGTVRGGMLDRKALGQIVFAAPEKLALLNHISHRFVKLEVEKRLHSFAMQGGRIAAIDAVELISAGMSERCAATVGILSDAEIRIERIMKRDNIGREAATARIEAQKPDAYYQDHCTHILINNADRERFASDCRQVFKEILNHG